MKKLILSFFNMKKQAAQQKEQAAQQKAPAQSEPRSSWDSESRSSRDLKSNSICCLRNR